MLKFGGEERRRAVIHYHRQEDGKVHAMYTLPRPIVFQERKILGGKRMVASIGSGSVRSYARGAGRELVSLLEKIFCEAARRLGTQHLIHRPIGLISNERAVNMFKRIGYRVRKRNWAFIGEKIFKPPAKPIRLTDEEEKIVRWLVENAERVPEMR